MKSRWATATVALVFVASACGTRASDTAGKDNQDPVTSPVAATSGATSTFGTLPIPCGPADPAKPNKATGQGVTADEITLSTISDPGGPVPGLNIGLFQTMDAFTAWCNGLGGINGRKINLLKKDAMVVKYKDMVAEACQDSFALVGGLGALDSLGAKDGDACGLVNVPASAASADQALAEHTYQPVPNMPSVFSVGPSQWIKKAFPGVETKAAGVYSKLQITEDLLKRFEQGLQTNGYSFVSTDSVNQNETNWGPQVVKLKNEGARYLTFVSTYEQILPMQKEFATQSWHPDVVELEGNFYDQRYPSSAKDQGADTTNTFVRVPVWPFEDADKNPAMKEYLAQLTKTVPDAVPAMLGVESWSAALLFATAAKAAGADLTRASLEAELKKIHSWDGGGLHGHTDPGNRGTSHCFVMMKVGDGAFTRAYPLADKDKGVYDNNDQKGMACPTDGLVTLKQQPGSDKYQAK